MCTLWQRIGRAARDMTLDAIAIIFVESQFLESVEKDVARAKRNATSKKRKANGPAEGSEQRGAKRRAVAADGGTIGRRQGLEAVAVVTDDAHHQEAVEEREQLLADRRREYASEERAKQRVEEAQKNGKGVTKKRQRTLADIDLEVADVANAGYRGIGCRRTPFKLFFNSDLTGKYPEHTNFPFQEHRTHSLPRSQ